MNQLIGLRGGIILERHGGRKRGAPSSAAPAVKKLYYEGRADELKKKKKLYYASEEQKLYREKNVAKIKERQQAYREKNADEIKKRQQARREKAATENALRNAALTDRMHADSAGAEFRRFTARQVACRLTEILKKPRDIFDKKSLAEAIESEEFALYFYSTRTMVVESNMANEIPTGQGGPGEAGRFLSARGSTQRVRATHLPSPAVLLSLSLSPLSCCLSVRS